MQRGPNCGAGELKIIAATLELTERQQVGLPRFAHFALLRAKARKPHAARVAVVECMQMLLESPSRRGLQCLLAAWLPGFQALRGEEKA